MSDVYEAWCLDPRSLTFGEWLDEAFGEWEAWLRDEAPGFLNHQWRAWPATEVPTPVQRTYLTVYDQCRQRLQAGQSFAVCFLDVVGLDQHLWEFGQKAEDVVAVLSQMLDQILLEPGLDGFGARVGKARFILIFPASDLAAVCTDVLDCFDFHFLRPTRTMARAVRTPTLKASMGVVTNQHRRYEHFSQIAELATQMLEYAKGQPGSVFVIDRRHDMEAEDSTQT